MTLNLWACIVLRLTIIKSVIFLFTFICLITYLAVISCKAFINSIFGAEPDVSVMASESTTVATSFTPAIEIASTLWRRAAKPWSGIVVEAIIKAATTLCTFGFFLSLAADLVEFALVVLPLLA